METADVVIAGAGIIGLSLALDLAQRNLSVIVLERSTAMSEASWAAAGMLAANDPENPPELRELAQLSLRLYPDYLATIERLSNKKVPIRTRTTLQACAAGFHECPPLSGAELRRLAPGFAPGTRDWIRLDEQSLDPRDLCQALPQAAKAAGVRVFENTPVAAVETDDRFSSLEIRAAAGSLRAAHFVECSGAWAQLFYRPPSSPPGVGVQAITPRKGQMLAVREPGPGRLDCVVRTPEIYLVPRGDGRIVIGATVEQAGYDKTTDPAAIAALLQAAAHLYPSIAAAEIMETWAGLRPQSPDGLPLIGNCRLLGPAIPGGNQGRVHDSNWIAAGHFRNGILLAPATARVLSQLIRGQSPEVDISPFDPARLSRQNTAGLPVLAPV